MSHCGNCNHGCCCYCTRPGCGFCHDKKCSDPKYYKNHYVCFTCKTSWKHSEEKESTLAVDKFWIYEPSRCHSCRKQGTEVGKCIRIPAMNKHKEWYVLERVHIAVNSSEFKTAPIGTIAHKITKDGFVKYLDSSVHKERSNFWLPTKTYQFDDWMADMRR